MKSFSIICFQVSVKYESRVLRYLLVQRYLQEKIAFPELLIQYSDIDFE